MEFKFAVNDIFKKPVVEINHTLIPPGFTGDRRSFWDAVNKVSEVINAMGEGSAAAQGLTKPITTAERLRNSEHTVYLLIDSNAGNGRGAVTGMLKTGKKGLYVFDRNGQHFQVSPPCVLDFYIHESRQRTGQGKRLFEHMLQTEGIEPVKMAIDRPSEKFLGFLNKHYTLSNPVKQMNNYVVFDGFFPNTPERNGAVEQNHSGGTPGKKQSANGLQTTSFAAPLGRYGAPRPHCSMGQIIHNQTSTIPKNTEPTGVRSAPETNYQSIPQYNSPGNPTNVTQSAPNIPYRPPEQIMDHQQYQQNNQMAQVNSDNLKYHQRQQNSDNVWQSFGASNLDQNQANFNQQANYYPQSQNYSLPQNTVTHSGDNAPQQFQTVEGQAMYQNTPPNLQYPAMPEPNMVQYNMMPNPVQPQAGQVVPNMHQYPSQYAMQEVQPGGGEMPQVQAPHVQSSVFQNAQRTTMPNVPYAQSAPTVAQMPQVQEAVAQFVQQETVPSTKYQQINPELNQPQVVLQNNHQQSVRHTPNYNAEIQNQQMMQQNDSRQPHNRIQTETQAAYSNLMIPQQNVLSSAQVPYGDPTASVHNVQSSTVNPNSHLQPNVAVTPSVPQYANEHLNQPQNQMNVASVQNIQSSTVNTHLQPNVAPSVPQFANQHLNQPQNQMNVTQSVPNANAPAHYANQITNQPQNMSYDGLNLPNITQSMPSTNVYPQYNQMAANQQNIAPAPQVNEMGMASFQYNNQNQNTLAPNSTVSHQGHNQVENIASNLSKTAIPPQYNANQRQENKEVRPYYSQSALNQQIAPQQAQQTVHQQYVSARTQPVPSQTNALNQNKEFPDTHQHMEGSQLNNNYSAEEMQAVNAKGDMRNVLNPDSIFEYGYPPQVPDPDTHQVMEEKVSSSPKLERPRSLSIQLSEEQTEDKNGDIESEVPAQEPEIEEEIIEKLEISENDAVIENKDDNNKTPGKKTPSHLTEQGFFDLKFYHNKLW